MGTRTPAGKGNGGCWIEIGVMLISDATLPSISVMVVFAGMRNSSPANNGVVMTTSLAVGNGTLTACAVSSGVIQMV